MVEIARVTLDFETYSEAGFTQDPDGRIRGIGPQGKGGLPVVGTPVYACHPSTEIVSLAFDSHDWYGLPDLWVPGLPAPKALLEHVANGGPVEAHNVTFEWWIWNTVGVRRHGWPFLKFEQCYCSMAKCRRYSLPGGLDNAAAVLGTGKKDPAGKRLIQKLTRPHTPTKNREAIRWTPATAWEDFQAMYDYNKQDVIAEDAVSSLIPELAEDEREVWLVDQYINARGVQVDTVTLNAALQILDQAERKYNRELDQITDGQVTAASELARLQTWLADNQGVVLPNMQKNTIAQALKNRDQLPGYAVRALQIRELLGSANIKKLHSLALQTSSDGRLRDQYMYCGADRTGRWSSGGVQLQNLSGSGPDACRCSECHEYFGNAVWKRFGACPRCGQFAGGHNPQEWGPDAAEQAVQDIRSGDLAIMERYWGDDVLEVLTGCLRAMITASPGKDLICVDFSAIEAVVAACISRCQWRIDAFQNQRDIYLESISRMVGKSYDFYQAYASEHGTKHPDRKRGKVAELAGTYGCWVQGWKDFGADKYYEDDEELKAAVLKWREESPEIVDAWGGQYRWCGPGKWDYRNELFGIEGAVIQAILTPGQWFEYIDLAYACSNDVLYCRLPSGRFLHYHRPRLDLIQDKLNRGQAYQITFEGYNSNPMKGPMGWTRMETWGSKLFENACQAIARDIQAGAMVRCERSGYPVVMHTHDEVTAEVNEGVGSVEHMAELMTERPAWASWWPIRGAGWRGLRYRKD